MRAKRFVAVCVGSIVMSMAVPAAARETPRANVQTAALAHWILGPAGKDRVRYASAHYIELTRNSEVRILAGIYIGTCRRRPGSHDRCRTEQYVSHEDHDPVFVMDPAMQTARLELGRHHVEWQSTAAPQMSLIGVDCDPENDEEYMGPHFGREGEASAIAFGRELETRSNDWDYGFLGRGGFVSGC